MVVSQGTTTRGEACFTDTRRGRPQATRKGSPLVLVEAVILLIFRVTGDISGGTFLCPKRIFLRQEGFPMLFIE